VFPLQQEEYNLATRPKILTTPRPISNSDFDEICESFKISPKKTAAFCVQWLMALQLMLLNL
jgi:hypothetical protein